jgi:hypothetical protein
MVKRAVVIGVNDYSIQGINSLSYCVNDAQSMYHLLVNAFGFDPSQIFYYANVQASRSNILRALRYVITSSEPGDVACFYYSGHGSRIRAERGRADADKYYEAIIPASGDWITDWELFTVANELAQSVVNFTVILDSCHSGGMHETDAAQKARSPVLSSELIDAIVRFLRTLIPCGICLPHDSTELNNNVGNVTAHNGVIDLDEDPDKTLVRLAKSTLIAGCKFDELSWEHPDFRHGFLTQSFLDLVNQSNFEISHHDLMDQLRRLVGQKVREKLGGSVAQTPQLRGQMNRMEEGFLQGWIDSR